MNITLYGKKHLQIMQERKQENRPTQMNPVAVALSSTQNLWIENEKQNFLVAFLCFLA